MRPKLIRSHVELFGLWTQERVMTHCLWNLIPVPSSLPTQLTCILWVISIFCWLCFLLKHSAAKLAALCWHLWISDHHVRSSNKVLWVFLMLWHVSVILTGSADCSILASDVETGKAIARLEDAHEWVLLVCSAVIDFSCGTKIYALLLIVSFSLLIFSGMA